jgi:hypothetical protein
MSSPDGHYREIESTYCTVQYTYSKFCTQCREKMFVTLQYLAVAFPRLAPVSIVTAHVCGLVLSAAKNVHLALLTWQLAPVPISAGLVYGLVLSAG